MESSAEFCFRCNKKDNIYYLTDYGLYVCSSCFPEFFRKKVLSTIRSFHMLREGDTVAVGVSGGKDSASLLHALSRLSSKLKVEVKPFHLHLGFGEYSDAALATAREIGKKSGRELAVFYLSDYQVRVEPIKSFPACAVCGALKRSIFNRIARKLGANVLATAHTFDDIFLFALKNLLSKKDNIPRAVLESSNDLVPRKIKPLYRMTETLTRLYCELEGLPFVTGACPVSDGRGHALKQVFAQIDVISPGFRRQLIDHLKRIYRKAGREAKNLEKECIYCKEPSTQDICAVCRVHAYQQQKQG